jgi:hypothetical protein
MPDLGQSPRSAEAFRQVDPDRSQRPSSNAATSSAVMICCPTFVLFSNGLLVLLGVRRRELVKQGQVRAVDVAWFVAVVETQLLLDRQAVDVPAGDGASGEAFLGVVEGTAV